MTNRCSTVQIFSVFRYFTRSICPSGKDLSHAPPPLLSPILVASILEGTSSCERTGVLSCSVTFVLITFLSFSCIISLNSCVIVSIDLVYIYVRYWRCVPVRATKRLSYYENKFMLLKNYCGLFWKITEYWYTSTEEQMMMFEVLMVRAAP